MIAFTLAETDPTAQDTTPLLIWGSVAIGVVFLLVLAIVAIRKKYFPPEEPSPAPAGFGVGDLKDLYDQGLISDDEYNTAKAKIVTASHKAFMESGKKGEKAGKK